MAGNSIYEDLGDYLNKTYLWGRNAVESGKQIAVDAGDAAIGGAIAIGEKANQAKDSVSDAVSDPYYNPFMSFEDRKLARQMDVSGKQGRPPQRPALAEPVPAEPEDIPEHVDDPVSRTKPAAQQEPILDNSGRQIGYSRAGSGNAIGRITHAGADGEPVTEFETGNARTWSPNYFKAVEMNPDGSAKLPDGSSKVMSNEFYTGLSTHLKNFYDESEQQANKADARTEQGQILKEAAERNMKWAKEQLGRSSVMLRASGATLPEGVTGLVSPFTDADMQRVSNQHIVNKNIAKNAKAQQAFDSSAATAKPASGWNALTPEKQKELNDKMKAQNADFVRKASTGKKPAAQDMGSLIQTSAGRLKAMLAAVNPNSEKQIRAITHAWQIQNEADGIDDSNARKAQALALGEQSLEMRRQSQEERNAMSSARLDLQQRESRLGEAQRSWQREHGDAELKLKKQTQGQKDKTAEKATRNEAIAASIYSSFGLKPSESDLKRIARHPNAMGTAGDEDAVIAMESLIPPKTRSDALDKLESIYKAKQAAGQPVNPAYLEALGRARSRLKASDAQQPAPPKKTLKDFDKFMAKGA